MKFFLLKHEYTLKSIFFHTFGDCRFCFIVPRTKEKWFFSSNCVGKACILPQNVSCDYRLGTTGIQKSLVKCYMLIRDLQRIMFNINRMLRVIILNILTTNFWIVYVYNAYCEITTHKLYTTKTISEKNIMFILSEMKKVTEIIVRYNIQ